LRTTESRAELAKRRRGFNQGMGFRGLITTIASRSETVIKDLEESEHGLKAESVILRDVFSYALDVKASAVYGSDKM
jgi:DNA repair protein RadC